MRQSLALLITFIALAPNAGAQDNVVAGYVLTGSSRLDHLAGRRDPVPGVSARNITIPLKRSGKLLLIEAEVDGVKGDFIFDTGAPYLVLNQTYFRTDTKSRNLSAGGITGGGDYQQSQQVKRLTMSGVEYLNLQADLTPLGHIEDARGVKILGLVGLNLFKAFEMEIDVRNNELYLRLTDDLGNVKSATPFKPDLVHPIKISNNAIFVDCSIAGKRLTYVLDTGAEINTLTVFCGKKVMETISIQGRSQLMGTGSQKVEVLYGSISALNIGVIAFANMRTLLTDMGDMSGSYGMVVDGILGYDFLDRGRLRVNFIKKTMEMQFFDNFKE